MPIVAAHNAVIIPTIATISIVSGASENKREFLAIKNMPAVTIVAACINAETGVGPAIASGNQTESGSCADLPQHPINKQSVIQNVIDVPNNPSLFAKSISFTSLYWRVPKCKKIRNIATRNPKSPTLFAMNAFFPASPVHIIFTPSNFLSYQNPMRR